MLNLLADWGRLTWSMIYESALLLLLGFVLAGVIRALVTQKVLTSVFGQGRFTQIFTSSLIGVPLPLCSCSVLPVAAQLRRSGLSRSGTVSFLISTPETGVDSIALSLRLLGPIFAVVRPLAALITALVSGLVTWGLLPANSGPRVLPVVDAKPKEKQGLGARLWEGQVYVVTDMLPELAYYLLWGYLLAGLAAALVPADLVREGIPGWLQYFVVVAVSLPVYVCATSSTPLAAVFLTLGIHPGAVLAFLLIGPATNLTSLVVQKQILGLKGTVLMTATIIVCAIIMGLVIDTFFGDAVLSSFSPVAVETDHEHTAWYDLIAALALSSIMLYYTGKHYYKKLRKRLTTQ
jgi:uncharacterized membrane protein YraQ (UPF0718 family)